MLTLYGDYVRHKGGEIGIGSLITLLGNFGLSEQSIRSAVSRMCRMGLLQARRDGTKGYYSLTKEGFNLLNKGAQRIFDRKKNHWDGLWSTVVYYIPEEKRQARDKLREELGWMGYGSLSTATWISPHNLTREVEEVTAKLQIKDYVQIFQSRQEGYSNGQSIISRGWDLDRIHKKYASFIAEFRPKLEDLQKRLGNCQPFGPGQCFVERFNLIDEYRRLPYFDPDLPEELLPADWLRSEAGELFYQYRDLLTRQANEYFDSVLAAY